jgi:hypothetical protein
VPDTSFLREVPLPLEEPVPERIGEYRILRVLGEGGMGTVYEAEQASPRRFVALKVIRPHLVATPRYRRRFAEEVRTLGRFSHPAIARIFEAGAAPDDRGAVRLFYVMELVVGVPLDQHVARLARLGRLGRLGQHGLGPAAIAELMATICDAVHHAHLKGVIHCDLKPGNIVVDGGGLPRILDFGIARIVGDEAREATATLGGDGCVIGTLAFASPEQAAGDRNRVDAMSDVYGLGATLYALLTGRPPHLLVGCGPVEAARVVERGSPACVRAVAPSCPMNLHAIVDKATRLAQGDRYDSAAAMAADLRRFAEGRPVVARPAPWFERGAAWVRRNRAVAASIGVAAVTLLAGVVVVAVTLAQLSVALAKIRAEQRDHARTRRATQGALLAADARHQRSRAFAEPLPVDEMPGYPGWILAAMDWSKQTIAGQDPQRKRPGRLLTFNERGDVVDRLDTPRTWPEWARPRFDVGRRFERGLAELQEAVTLGALAEELDGDGARELVRCVRIENDHLHLSVLEIDDLRSVVSARGAPAASCSQLWNHGDFVDVVWDEPRRLLWCVAYAAELPYFIPELAGWDSAGCPVGAEDPRVLMAIDPAELCGASRGSAVHRVVPPLRGDAAHPPVTPVWTIATRPPPSMRDVGGCQLRPDTPRGGGERGVVSIAIQAFEPFPVDDEQGRLGRLYVTFRYVNRDRETIASVDLDAKGIPTGAFHPEPMPARDFDAFAHAAIARADPATEIVTIDVAALSTAGPAAEELLFGLGEPDAAIAAAASRAGASSSDRRSIERCIRAMSGNWRWLNNRAGEIIERDEIVAGLGADAASLLDAETLAGTRTALRWIDAAAQCHEARCPSHGDGSCLCEWFIESKRALALAALGEWVQCVERAELAISLHDRHVALGPDNPADHAILAIALHALGRTEEADAALVTAEQALASSQRASAGGQQGSASELAPRLCARARVIVMRDR